MYARKNFPVDSILSYTTHVSDPKTSKAWYKRRRVTSMEVLLHIIECGGSDVAWGTNTEPQTALKLKCLVDSAKGTCTDNPCSGKAASPLEHLD